MNKIIEQLIKDKTSYQAIKSFSDKPGIYALFFVGSGFPLQGYHPDADQIIYIGKTESSQASRDRDTHFANGKTGSSTLRRSFGAMLMEQFNLTPIPRGQADIEKNRTSLFKFDDPSEEKLSDWMRTNLALSFYEHSGSKQELDHLESHLISLATPILNIDGKNPRNPYSSTIKAMRKACGTLAYSGSFKPPIEKAPTVVKKEVSLKKVVFKSDIHKYEDIWKQLISAIIESIKEGKSLEMYLDDAAFKASGTRTSGYDFRLEIINGEVVNNISGNAVARDLARVLTNTPKFMAAAKGRMLVLRLDKSFNFSVEM